MSTRNSCVVLLAVVFSVAISACSSDNSHHSSHNDDHSYSSPIVNALSNGNYVVTLGGGKVASFDRHLDLISESNCSRSDVSRARRAIEDYRDDHGDRHGSHHSSRDDDDRHHSSHDDHDGHSWNHDDNTKVTALSNGNYLVTMGHGKVAGFDKHLKVISESNCERRDIDHARRAIEAYRDHHGRN